MVNGFWQNLLMRTYLSLNIDSVLLIDQKSLDPEHSANMDRSFSFMEQVSCSVAKPLRECLGAYFSAFHFQLFGFLDYGQNVF